MSTHSQIHGHIDRVSFSKLSTGSISLNIYVGDDNVTIFIDGEQGVLDFRRAVIDAVYELLNKSVPKEAA
jgi:hypothetical protein